MQYIHSSKKGFALSIVLWIVAALLFGAATLAVLAKDTLSLTKGVKNKLETQLMVEDVFEAFKFYVVTADYTNNALLNSNLNDFEYKFPNKIIVDGRWYRLNNGVEISIKDASQMLNTMWTPPNIIASLATTSSQREERYTIRDSIKDWIDKDNVVNLNGAEASKYELENGANFSIRNSNSIQSIYELRLINGIDKMSSDEWNALKERLFYGNGCTVNLTLINSRYLSNILKINESKAESLVQEREKNLEKFMNLIYKMKAYNASDNMGFFISREFKVKIKVSSGLSVSTLEAIIDFREKPQRQYTLIKEVIN